ncbi:MAG: SDR family oxidoreductase [Candidatus Hydrogenedentes bacterium]|nr:SDR family oxidoreductase [Candidatus Hydrogenedentota bacterium]
MRTLIAGCGYVGAALGEFLARDGHAVWGIMRNAESLAGIQTISADVTRPETLSQLPIGLDAVVYAVGAGGYDEARYRAVYVDGVRNLLDALISQRQQPRRFVFVSSTGVYAQHSGEWVDETSPAEQTHFPGATLLAGERLAHSCAYPATVVRFGGIYGPGRTRLIDSVRDGSATVSTKQSYINLIHRDDCAGILHHVLASDAPQSLYLGVDNQPVDRRILLEWVAERICVAPPRVVENSESTRGARSNKRCNNARITAEGYSFRYPTFREGHGGLIG